ncbi:CDP-glycerol glycerophosphotransferase (TagB/SpsB family) [Brevibacterium epidermidis]|uniref:CDP-glycerol glycerophosphotransferase (TagB/SpsB family) n=1 Tax=Brevibacterium epidermidis TaxID=1698 RepID=A0ABV4EJ66_BREEP
MPTDPVVVKNVDFRGRNVTVTLDRSAKVRGLTLHNAGNKVELEAIGPSIFSTTLPELSERFRTHGERQWALLARTTEGNEVDVYHASVDYLLPGTSCVRLSANSAGKVRLAQRFRRVTVTGATNDRDRLLIIGRIDPPERLKIVLKSSEQTIKPAEYAFHADGSYTAVYDLTTTGAEGGKVAALAGGYHLKYGETTNRADSWVRAAGKLAIRPVNCFTEWNTLRVEGKNSSAVSVIASPPWSASERSKYGRYRLRNKDWGPLTYSIVFESYSGKNANDNPRAIFDAINEIRPEIPLYWSVRDRRVDVPTGGIAIVEGTAEWHKALATSRVLVNNNNFPYYVEKRSGQFYLQTWHGTPIKKLLNDLPRKKTPLTYRRNMKAEAGKWDLLLAQSNESETRLRSAFQYKGEVSVCEYPRNYRILTSKITEDQIKTNLNIDINGKKILYAPTWRDQNRLSAIGTNEDLESIELLADLPNTTVLVRGHHMSKVLPIYNDSVIDVSSYPHVEDLIRIADILVTDFSSVAYDFQLTGKPVLFYAKDREEYVEHRGVYELGENIGKWTSDPSELVVEVGKLLNGSLNATNSGESLDGEVESLAQYLISLARDEKWPVETQKGAFNGC